MRPFLRPAVALAGFALSAACIPAAGGQPSHGPTVGPAIVVTRLGERAFTPAYLTATTGTTVRLIYRNSSDESHNLTFLSPLSAATATILEPGREELLEFPAPATGSYRFVCTIHPGMEGTLAVE
jgi:plastocyanin